MTEDQERRYHQELHHSLSVTIRSGSMGLKAFPGMLLTFLRENAWKERYIPQIDKLVKFERFIEYVETPPLDGLGATYQLLLDLCQENIEARQALDDAVIGTHGGDKKSAEIKCMNHTLDSNSPPSHHLQSKLLRRLRRDFPELHAQVIAGQKTITAAAVEAGIYPKRISVNLRDAESAAQSIVNNAGPEYARQLADALRQCSA